MKQILITTFYNPLLFNQTLGFQGSISFEISAALAKQ